MDQPVWKLTLDEIRSAFIEYTGDRPITDACDIINLLAQLGLNPSPTELACMLPTYIRPGADKIGVHEFIQIFQDVRVTQTELSYEGNVVVEAATKHPWIVPVDGTVVIKVTQRGKSILLPLLV